MNAELPNMEFCKARGWVITPAPLELVERTDPPRKYRRGQLTKNEYQRLRRSRFQAAGLTTRGTPRKYNKKNYEQ